MTDTGRASPPTARVVAVLDFLASHPQEQFGLSELARRLDLSKPTCLGIVTTLADAGYLVRDAAEKTYRLGPRLITLGHTAQESMRISPAARAELRRLSEAFNATAALSAVVDDRITLLELVAPHGSPEPVQVGQSYPFAPPVGLMFVLWDERAVRRGMPRVGLSRGAADAGRAPPVRHDGGHVEQPARRITGSARRTRL
jgi:DNA-binding IclR family transcriptional regulator